MHHLLRWVQSRRYMATQGSGVGDTPHVMCHEAEGSSLGLPLLFLGWAQEPHTGEDEDRDGSEHGAPNLVWQIQMTTQKIKNTVGVQREAKSLPVVPSSVCKHIKFGS